MNARPLVAVGVGTLASLVGGAFLLRAVMDDRMAPRSRLALGASMSGLAMLGTMLITMSRAELEGAP